MSVTVSFRSMETKVPFVADQKIEQLLSSGIESFGLWPGAQYQVRYVGQILNHEEDVATTGITDGDKIVLQRVRQSLPFDKSTPFLLMILLVTFVFGYIVICVSEIFDTVAALASFGTDRAKQKLEEIFEWF